jgi:hypothetical protein
MLEIRLILSALLMVPFSSPSIWRRKLRLKAKLKQNCKQFFTLWFQALSSRRFGSGLDRFKLHRLTSVPVLVACSVAGSTSATTESSNNP